MLRKAKKKTLRGLASETGLSHGFICDIEHNRCNPSVETLKLLGNALGVGPEYFLSKKVVGDDHVNSAS